MAYGLHFMQQSLCPKSGNLCEEMIPVNGSVSYFTNLNQKSLLFFLDSL